MATTSLWPVKGSAKTVLDYARNLEKTTELENQLSNVVGYAADGQKTEQRAYVTCLNCTEGHAAQQFMETKRLWGKLEGRACYHGYQSFRAGEVTAEQAHRIGVELAQELWGGRFEVLVATHCNTNNYHNHFVVNSVSFADGKKFYNSRADYARMREVSDRLCQEHGLSVPAPNGKGRSYVETQAEREGKATLRGAIRADIDRTILASASDRDFIRVMTAMGYAFKTNGKSGAPLKYPALQPPDAKGYFRFHKLGQGYRLEEILTRILENTKIQLPFPEAAKPKRRLRYRGRFDPRKKCTGLRALYFRYCYELHIIKKHPASLKRVSFHLREDVAKLDRLDRELRFLASKEIVTMEKLEKYISTLQSQITGLTAGRQELRKLLRRCAYQDGADEIAARAQAKEITIKLREIRKEVNLCQGIAQRSEAVRANLGLLINEKAMERKEREQHVQFRGRGGAGGPRELGGR